MNKIVRFVFFLLFVFCVNQSFSMDVEVDYNKFFDLCRKNDLELVKKFMDDNPTLDINYQDNYKFTALLHAATAEQWFIVWYLIKRGADVTIKDKFGQSLFSKAVYFSRLFEFEKIVKYYTKQQINELCKTMHRERDCNYYYKIPLRSFISNVLDGKINFDSVDGRKRTALQIASTNGHVATRIALLKKAISCGQLVDLSDEKSGEKNFKKQSLFGPFVVREAFNDGRCLSDYLLPLIVVNKFLQEKFIPDVAWQIKQLYNKCNVNLPLIMEAQLWKPVCVDACKYFEINDPDVNRCLINTFLWPQEIKTRVNLALAFEGK